MGRVSIAEKRWMGTFARNLERAMKDVGMTQAELARKSGLSTGTIARYLTCDRSPKMFHVCELADALGVRTDELLNEETCY